MQTPTEAGPASPSALTVAALTAGVLAIVMAVYQVATPGAPEATFESFADWLREVVFLAFLISSIGATLAARRAGLAPRAVALLIGIGYGAVAIGVATGMVMREDPDWFVLLGGPGNLLAVAGFVAWGFWSWRRRVLPGYASVLCGVGGAVAVLGSEFGSSVLVAGFWFSLGAHARRQISVREASAAR